MFASSVQPPLVSLFSSSSSNCLDLFQTATDSSLLSDSFVCLLHDATSRPGPPAPAKLIASPSIISEDDGNDPQGRTLDQTVLHIQSPTLRTTYIRCPASSRPNLGLKHPWLHLQVRNLGREWSFEVGIVDRAGREGILRCSTFQVMCNFVPQVNVLMLAVAHGQHPLCTTFSSFISPQRSELLA